jgi:hypothetical protein
LCCGPAAADVDCGIGKPTCITHIDVDNGVLAAEWQSPVTGLYTVRDHLELSGPRDPTGRDVWVQADDTGHGTYTSGMAALPGEFFLVKVQSCSHTDCGPWDAEGFRVPEKPQPRPVQLPYSPDDIAPCLACEVPG